MSYSLFINRRSDFKLIMISLDTKWFQLKATVRKKITTKIIMLYNSSYSNMSLWAVRAFPSQLNILYLQCKHIHTDGDFAILNTRYLENGHLQCSRKTASILAFAFNQYGSSTWNSYINKYFFGLFLEECIHSPLDLFSYCREMLLI